MNGQKEYRNYEKAMQLIIKKIWRPAKFQSLIINGYLFRLTIFKLVQLFYVSFL